MSARGGRDIGDRGADRWRGNAANWLILRHDAPGSEHPKALWSAVEVVVEARDARRRRFRTCAPWPCRS